VIPVVTRGSVEVWWTRLEAVVFSDAAAERMLTAEELARSSRLREAQDRARFITARAWLRSVLGRYLKCAPKEVVFGEGEFGKPLLSPVAHRPGLHFNLSHTGEYAVCALTGAGEVGIDIEHVRPAAATPEVASQFLTARELAEVFERAPQATVAEFFRRWTLKEAVLKAAGTGLRASPHEVFLQRVSPAEANADAGWSADFEGRRWAAREFTIAADVAGALAISGDAVEMQLRCWS